MLQGIPLCDLFMESRIVRISCEWNCGSRAVIFLIMALAIAIAIE